jgi:hypothetical protein
MGCATLLSRVHSACFRQTVERAENALDVRAPGLPRRLQPLRKHSDAELVTVTAFTTFGSIIATPAPSRTPNCRRVTSERASKSCRSCSK